MRGIEAQFLAYSLTWILLVFTGFMWTGGSCVASRHSSWLTVWHGYCLCLQVTCELAVHAWHRGTVPGLQFHMDIACICRLYVNWWFMRGIKAQFPAYSFTWILLVFAGYMWTAVHAWHRGPVYSYIVRVAVVRSYTVSHGQCLCLQVICELAVHAWHRGTVPGSTERFQWAHTTALVTAIWWKGAGGEKGISLVFYGLAISLCPQSSGTVHSVTAGKFCFARL